jgi:thiol-disulfide isomerase/thioredoxin
MKFSIKHSLFLATFAFLASCGSEEEMETTKVKEDQQSIAGSIPDAAGKTIVAQVYNVDRWLQLGQSPIDSKGNFNIKLPKEAFVVQLVIEQSAAPVVLGGNDSIFVKTDFPNMMENFSVSNLEHAGELNKLIQLNAAFNAENRDKMTRYRELQTGPEAEALLAEIIASKKKIENYAIDFIEKNPNSSITQLMAMQLYPDMGLENWDLGYGDYLEDVLIAYQKSFPEARFTRGLESNLNLWLDTYEQSLNSEKRKSFYGNLDRNVNIGSPAPDIWMDKVDGGDMKLSDLKGQYVLIDFWASWCGPCRRENPNVVRLYKKYKDKGFTVFSVSLDDNAKNWKAAIESDQLEWPHHVSDLLKWNSVVVQLYKFDGIPHTVLIDKKGTIIGKNLRGQELENKLKEIFGS